MRLSRALVAVFLFSTVFSLLGYLWELENYPPCFDFDAATDAIYINNYNFQEHYDHYFRDSDENQDRFRSWYAAHRLPFIATSCALNGGELQVGAKALSIDWKAAEELNRSAAPLHTISVDNAPILKIFRLPDELLPLLP